MKDPWLKRWDARYSNTAYAFGEKPNEYLREQLEKLQPGSILFAAEGEGRNAVYAAKLGWTVSAFDISTEGRKKALQLAEKNKVYLNYEVGQLPDLAYTEGQFDAIVLIYAHFPASIKSTYHKLLSAYLRKGGTVIFEAFGKKHLPYREKNPKVGGPRDLESLFSMEELLQDFTDYEIIELVEKEVELNEGLYHSGTGSVVRFVGRKK
ncbi:class I SAM-dependent methyltransferase [Flagellimonas alvinocaridis]|uniref:Class I SAM-dependent methyltransferase n=1 Tax=Flagellimonas alvinocaridis TaxID=2530200 RepID=A0A4S8S0K0_9FLAO|nr:class I SAM-dependent methyltransferase [Allomuricauda alvinocaridis]THV60214.1 class I SAM-dependent methyltransferase [Allomuricauda alvinocaridis]